MTATPESARALLNSDDYGDRLSGVNQLRQLDPALAFELIQPAITDANSRVRYSAVSQMDSLGSVDLATTQALLRERLLTDSEIDVRSAAADAIAALKLTALFEELANAYEQTEEWLLQFSIVAALGEMGDPRGYDLLITALDSDNALLQTAAIGSLGELGDRRAVPHITRFADSDDWQLRHRTAQALARLNGADAQATLQRLSQDSTAQVAEAAQRGLITE
ncbi:MAG: HEAT repeat domain-containing protein [Spirulinaceae cyanobacterium RM2_2_10]|nr:HEAT repeat domain-containing protein [Spirulinaceae cyanobacterium SM2_1_0]NJO21001.1 HEAT repeat domain-containing protein [Spirulinaceae cyanobacterium RM2_2_10]